MTSQSRQARIAPQLAALARAHGVCPSYVDVFGMETLASERSIMAALRECGVDIAQPADASVLAAEHERALNERVLPPVTVLWAGAPLRITLGNAERVLGGACIATLQLENGTAELRLAVSAHGTIDLPADLPIGYHQLRVEDSTGRAHKTHILHAPTIVAQRGDLHRVWGLFEPIHAIRRAGDWGIGDLRGAHELAQRIAQHGGKLLGATPLLAGFMDEPFDASPYAPVSRLFWNEIYLDLERLPGLTPSDLVDLAAGSDTTLSSAKLAQLELVDYRAVFRNKWRAIQCAATAIQREAGPNFKQFIAWRNATEFLAEYCDFRAGIEGVDSRDAHAFAQWAMDCQLRDLAADGEIAGLYLDYPVGVHAAGFDVSHFRSLFAQHVSVGAPPDALVPEGQDWGLAPLRPAAVRAQGYRYVAASLRHVMRHASAVRVDHVMGLNRLFWIPADATAVDGVYVEYPEGELWAVVCIESHRSNTAVIGEDLGTVPPSVQARLAHHRMRRSYVLELAEPADDAPFALPGANALAMLDTHDTATFIQFWDDLAAPQRASIVAWLRSQQAFDDRTTSVLDGPTAEIDAAAVAAAFYVVLARSDADILLVTLENLLGIREPHNVAGTSGNELPNWRRRLPDLLEPIFAAPAVAAGLVAVNDGRSYSMREAGL